MDDFAKKILTWYDQYGRKNLPWHQNRSPYFVWLSEVMLQQTQVSTVIPYFENFITHFPALENLANAPLDDVLRLWAGLGYYTRARNLHRCAQIIQNQYQGSFPTQLESLLRLPGIGRSTAGAIIAQAFNQFGVILDGNVKRVLARYHAIDEPLENTQTQKKLWEFATQHTPRTRIAHYTQAIMDLGAMVCTRSNPKCTSCPLQLSCDAFQLEQPMAYPVKSARKKIPLVEKFFLIIQNAQQQILLEQQAAPGIWGGLWSLPTEESLREIEKNFSIQKQLPELLHAFSHYKLKLKPLLVSKKNKKILQVREHQPQRWVALAELHLVGLPAPIKKILRASL